MVLQLHHWIVLKKVNLKIILSLLYQTTSVLPSGLYYHQGCQVGARHQLAKRPKKGNARWYNYHLITKVNVTYLFIGGRKPSASVPEKGECHKHISH